MTLTPQTCSPSSVLYKIHHFLLSRLWHRLGIILDFIPSVSCFLPCIWSFTNPSQLRLLVYALHFPAIILSICHSHLDPPREDGFLLIHHLQRSQRDFFKKHKSYWVTPVLKTLQWHPSVCKIIFQFSKWFTWALHDTIPVNISRLFEPLPFCSLNSGPTAYFTSWAKQV